ncbi:MAG: hypothetical protein WCG23_01355 [bacterium]
MIINTKQNIYFVTNSKDSKMNFVSFSAVNPHNPLETALSEYLFVEPDKISLLMKKLNSKSYETVGNLPPEWNIKPNSKNEAAIMKDFAEVVKDLRKINFLQTKPPLYVKSYDEFLKLVEKK